MSHLEDFLNSSLKKNGSGYWFSYMSNDLGETWPTWSNDVADGQAVGWGNGFDWDASPVTPLASSVPLPAAVWLLGGGLAGLLGFRRRK